MACVDTIVTENLDYCVDLETVAGISPTEIYCARVSDFETIVALPALDVATTLEEAGTIAGPHTFPAGKGFFKIGILSETGLVENANEGEKGSKSNRNSFSGTLPGTSATVAGFIRKYQNQPMIFLVSQVDGVIKQIGSKASPAFLSEASGSSGQKIGDVNGTPVKFEAVNVCPPPTYTGAITEFTPA